MNLQVPHRMLLKTIPCLLVLGWSFAYSFRIRNTVNRDGRLRRETVTSPVGLYMLAVPMPPLPPTMPSPRVEISQPSKVLEAFHKPNSVILDVRTIDEIALNGYIRTASAGAKSNKHPWLQVSCSTDDCPLLNVAAEDLIQDKSAPVIIHCASGKRASRAKEILDNRGYKEVINAGGYKDLEYLQKEALK